MGPRRTQARRPGVCSMLSGGACCGDNSLSSSLLSGLRVRNIALSRARPPVVLQGRQPKGIGSPGHGLACAGLPLACRPTGTASMAQMQPYRPIYLTPAPPNASGHTQTRQSGAMCLTPSKAT